jgi:hypothetical protein
MSNATSEEENLVTRLAVALMCCAFACAAPETPRTLRRGATAPAPAPVRPGVGAPVVGQPGYVGPLEELSKSPHGRVLPETPRTRREPGIWATASEDLRVAEIIGEDLLRSFMPENANPYDRVMVSHCIISLMFVYVANEVESPGVLLHNEKIYTQKQRRCMASTIYHGCAQGIWEQNREDRKAARRANRLEPSSLDNFLSRAAEIKRTECDGVVLPDKAEKSVKAKVRRIRNYRLAPKQGAGSNE